MEGTGLPFRRAVGRFRRNRVGLAGAPPQPRSADPEHRYNVAGSQSHDAINEAQVGEIGGALAASTTAAKRKVPFWRQPPIYRYGFIAFILVVWELVGPLVNPIFFSYPSKITTAAYHLTLSGELPYYTWQSLQVCSTASALPCWSEFRWRW